MKHITLKLILFFGLLSWTLSAGAQDAKKFSKQFETLAKAPMEEVIGALKTKEDYVYDAVYHSKISLDEFETSIGIRGGIGFLFATYKVKATTKDFDRILSQLKSLPYDFEIKNDNKLYEKEVLIKSKTNGQRIAEITLDNFGSINIDFASKM